MPNFYHVTLDVLAPGQVLAPGRFGRGIRGINTPGVPLQGSDAIIVAWEATLETARLLLAPTAPSRFNCVFAMATMDDAVSFRDRFRQNSHIYEVTCVEGTLTHDENFGAITDPPRDGTHVLDFMPDYAISYWRDAPTGAVEVVIGGPVTVVRLVE